MIVTDQPRLRLRPPTHHVHPRAVTWWRLQDSVLWVGLVVAGGVVLLFDQQWWLVLLEAAVAVAGALDLAFYPRTRYERHRWEVTDQAVYVRDGVLVEDWRVAPLSRVRPSTRSVGRCSNGSGSPPSPSPPRRPPAS